MNGNQDLSTPSVGTIAELEAVRATDRADGAMIYVLDTGVGQGAPFFLNKASTAVPDGATVVAPALNQGEGRWLIGGGAGADPLPLIFTIGLSTSDNTGTAHDMGALQLDLSEYPDSTVTFRCVVQATSGAEVEVSLYDSTNGALVASSVLTSTSTSPVVVEADVTADLDPGAAIYIARVRVSDPAPPSITDIALCLGATLVVEPV